MKTDKRKEYFNIALKLAKKSVFTLILAIFLFSVILPASVNMRTLDVGVALAKKSPKNEQKSELILKESRGLTPRLAKKSSKPMPNSVVRAVITAYTSTPDQTDDSPFIAATGKRVHDGMIAANWLPFGTEVKIPSVYGDKIFTVEDRMNERFGYGHLDVWLDTSRDEALKFGVKVVDVEVYYPSYQLTLK
ncbi:MAG: hypothetical protein COU31_03915 [Candidatus Magasanikbacteria bacterium CG10_big_fil_rev_8_21_14_0_10_40_10]|uniref:3D domain-containing protein n=1 Tax=Candidatus Magasanikbacteria bacterium CG10_big_fil_rev_8_21_14_0_10_40_10 TaxID=1974648 RepID=A0A2M6W348_9BACT|nr:MAG: hypothetical protein COU31_03915 [Candidatus Magasanikbacteria bacterium CG10_big_fil_rev_8_21_14_0_10_40_10]